MRKASDQLKLRVAWDFRSDKKKRDDKKKRKKRSNSKDIWKNKLLKLLVFISSFISVFWVDF